jgi:hypothetical protein
MTLRSIACFQHWAPGHNVTAGKPVIKYTSDALPQITLLLEIRGREMSGRVCISARRSIFHL